MGGANFFYIKGTITEYNFWVIWNNSIQRLKGKKNHAVKNNHQKAVQLTLIN